MALYRRRLPHIDDPGHGVFLTWRLNGSLPAHRSFSTESVTTGEAFKAMDRLLDEVSTGPFHLRQPAIADLVVEAIHYSAAPLGRYELHAFVVMPNHVHLLITPRAPLAVLTKTLKGLTARRANAVLGTTGRPFWQEESYDHRVRDDAEFRQIRRYIEENPVRAGLVRAPHEYRWSSAFEAAAAGFGG
jgi:putative DNA methylase